MITYPHLVTNPDGRTFNVRLIAKGDRYGHRDCLTHEIDQPMVEFWDATYEQDPRFTPGLGQFVTRYFLATLRDFAGQCGLALDGGVPEWWISTSDLSDVLHQIEVDLQG